MNVIEITRSLCNAGAFAGHPVTFVRLTGPEQNDRCRAEAPATVLGMTKEMSVKDIVREVQTFQTAGIVALSDEARPLTDQDLPLFEALQKAGFETHLTVSGAYTLPDLPTERLSVEPTGPERLKQLHGHSLIITVDPAWSTRSSSAWTVVNGIASDTSFSRYYLRPTVLRGHPVNLHEVWAMVTDPVRNSRGRWALCPVLEGWR